jgi:hypothetical protein
MIYLSGAVQPKLHHPQLGWMLTPDMGNRLPPGDWWAFDNACFAHPGEFDWARWEKALRRTLAQSPDRCLFVVAPDVPFDAEGTIRRFAQYREQLAALGQPVAFVTQDGMGEEDVPWSDAAAVFVGGSTVWKTGQESAAIVAAAKVRERWVHMGRVNSLRRLQVARSMGCDSVDGTFLKYAPDINWPRLQRWLSAMNENPVMEIGA